MASTQASLTMLFVLAAAALSSGCGKDQLLAVNELVSVVSGTPVVTTGLPGVERLDGGVDGGAVFGPAAPYQVDTFNQQQIQKVDILWIISNSGAMRAKQERVSANFVTFMQFLLQQHIDFHLGVISTDIYDPTQSGRLINAAGLPAPWIDVNTPNPLTAFAANANVGTSGSHDVKPLLAGMLALTPPLTPTTPMSPDAGAANCADTASGPECFLRPDAALYVVIVSDHEDNSCSPLLASTEGCDDGAAALNGFGDTDYWTRFYSGLKGANGSSKVAAIVSTEADTFQCATTFAHLCDRYDIPSPSVCGGVAPNCNIGSANDPCCVALYSCYEDLLLVAPYCDFQNVVDASNSHAAPPYFEISSYIDGCLSFDSDAGVVLGPDGGVESLPDAGVEFSAWTAPRLTEVALNTTGIATSICESSYTPALADLGLQAAGLRTQFPLSRAPIPGTIALAVAGAPVQPGPSTWQYVECAGQTPANVIQFTSPPDAGASIVVSYYVNVLGLANCQ